MNANLLRKLADKTPSWLIRIIGNLYFPYLGAGIRCTRVTEDYTEIDIRMKLTWYNRNYVGTQFGGSLYSMTDPYYMLMLINNIGRDYVVWDKAAKIDFKKPGRGTVYAYFRLAKDQIAAIKKQADENPKFVFDLPVNVVDQDGAVIAEVIKTMYVRRKDQIRNEAKTAQA
jgi:hypothetical protein